MASGRESRRADQPDDLTLGDRHTGLGGIRREVVVCLLYTSDAADERSSVDLGGRRIIKKKKKDDTRIWRMTNKRYTNILK